MLRPAGAFSPTDADAVPATPLAPAEGGKSVTGVWASKAALRGAGRHWYETLTCSADTQANVAILLLRPAPLPLHSIST
jgi:hypothetical protein